MMITVLTIIYVAVFSFIGGYVFRMTKECMNKINNLFSKE
jgi:hypothetical protein